MGFLSEVLNNVGKEYGGKGFTAGTHKVIIGTAEATTDSKDRDIIKVTVFDKDDEELSAEATLWFHTEGGAKMGVSKVLGILVHNQQTEEKKQAVSALGKKLFGTIDTPKKSQEVAVKLLNEKLTGKEAFLVVEVRGDYTTSRYGDLWHYEAKAKTDDKPKVDTSQAPGVEASDLPDFD